MVDLTCITPNLLYKVFLAIAVGILCASFLAPIAFKWAFIIFSVVALIFGVFFFFTEKRQKETEEQSTIHQ